jgi:hypothetical protein
LRPSSVGCGRRISSTGRMERELRIVARVRQIPEPTANP